MNTINQGASSGEGRRDGLITADSQTVSGTEFFDAVFGMTLETREQSDRLMSEQCIRAIHRGDTYGWPPSMVDECRKLIAEREQLTEVERGIAPDNGNVRVAA